VFIGTVLEYNLCSTSLFKFPHFFSFPLSLSLSLYIYIYTTYCLGGDHVPHPVCPVNTASTYSQLILLLVTKLHEELPRADYQFVTHNKLNHCAVKFCGGFLTV